MRRSVWDWVIVVVVILAASVISIYNYVLVNRNANEQVLMAQLLQIRTSVMLYTVVNKEHPATLKTMVDEKLTLPDGDVKSYLIGLKPDNGTFIGPFDYPYSYDAKTGWVWSDNPKYSTWQDSYLNENLGREAMMHKKSLSSCLFLLYSSKRER